MENKNTNKSLKELVILAIVIFIIGIVIVCSNLGQVNEKIANFEKNDEDIEIRTTVDTETIMAAYTPKTEVASHEVVSRYAKARERELYISIDEIKISKDMDLTVRCNISREDFITLMSNVKADTSGFFEGNAGLIYDICAEYSLNEIFFCGLISAESGWDIASNHRRTHNYISLMGSNNSLIQFSSVKEGLEKAAKTLHNNYLSENGRFYCGKTLSAVRTRFCPVNPNWTNLVYGRMQQILN